MDTQNPSAPSRARSRVGTKNHPNRDPEAEPGGGLLHEHTRHTTRFTVIGNHLAQHPELSLLAIGLAAHLQSLPQGACADIKSLAARFPEGPTRIAAALRELETHGYLRRERRRIPGGRIVTRTISCNQPSPRGQAAPARTPVRTARASAHDTPSPRKGSRPLPAVPHPAHPSPGLLQKATDLLAGLRRIDSRLPLSAQDTGHLAPGVAAWLERDVTPTAVRDALTADLPPDGPRRPAALLAHRLNALLPPLPPARPAAGPPPAVIHPLQNCDGCNRAFRAPERGRCRDCRCDLRGAT
ncbi:helix-turn-helix domain-containing protein [Streptomyces sp. NBC_00285]|uniref:helix-turn-helix domain-containing protein n=1 Tax=Streptomyces sp. NBC_00285 TaxID=2975700 RepID=UPI002E2D1FD2|nr:helix-turn-helix domain-containing protein [Streptomyces sp. NBC_00285]